MKGLKVLFLLMAMAFIGSCASARGPGAPIPKVALNPGEALAVDLEEPIFYEKLNIKEKGLDGKWNFSIDEPTLRSDKISQEVGAMFTKKLAEFLKERGVEVYTGASVKIGSSMALGSKKASSSTLLVLGAFYSITITDSDFSLKRFAYTSLAYVSSMEPPVTDYPKLATRLAELTANDLVIHMRQKEKLAQK